jgi:hypothetical protein
MLAPSVFATYTLNDVAINGMARKARRSRISPQSGYRRTTGILYEIATY